MTSLPGGGQIDRSDLWNAVELHHKRGDAVVAREFEISLPVELLPSQRDALAFEFGQLCADKYGVAVDVCLHDSRTITKRDLEKNPDQYHQTDEKGRRHNANYHAHVMMSACAASPTGELGKKCVELDPIHCQRAKIPNFAQVMRPEWERMANRHLERAGHAPLVNMRSNKARGIDREPTKHLGPAAHGYERRTGQPSWLRQRQEQETVEARIKAAAQAGAGQRADASKLIDLQRQLGGAIAERNALIDKAIAERDKLVVRVGPTSIKMLDEKGLYAPPSDIAQALHLIGKYEAINKYMDAAQAQAAPAPAPAPAPRIDTSTSLAALIKQREEEEAQWIEPDYDDPSRYHDEAQWLSDDDGVDELYATEAEEALNWDWYEYELDGELYRRDTPRAEDADRELADLIAVEQAQQHEDLTVIELEQAHVAALAEDQQREAAPMQAVEQARARIEQLRASVGAPEPAVIAEVLAAKKAAEKLDADAQAWRAAHPVRAWFAGKEKAAERAAREARAAYMASPKLAEAKAALADRTRDRAELAALEKQLPELERAAGIEPQADKDERSKAMLALAASDLRKADGWMQNHAQRCPYELREALHAQRRQIEHDRRQIEQLMQSPPAPELAAQIRELAAERLGSAKGWREAQDATQAAAQAAQLREREQLRHQARDAPEPRPRGPRGPGL